MPTAQVSLPEPLPKRLNVGCGFDIRPGYLNVDLHARHHPDLVADVTDLPMLPSGYFEEIVAQDVLEHFERSRTAPALTEWSRLLAPEGILRVRVPSLMDLFEMLASPERRSFAAAEEIVHLMYGTQAYNGDYHLAGFTAALLDGYLRNAGLLICEASILHGWLFDVSARKVAQLDDDAEFLHGAYFTILGRPIDPAGLKDNLEALAQGRTDRQSVESTLRQSPEATFLAHNPSYLLRHAHRLSPHPITVRIAAFVREVLRRIKR